MARITPEEVQALLEKPFLDLVYEAQTVHRQHFRPGAVQVSSLLSVKTGGCPEDCGYCSQAARYHTDTERDGLMEVDEVLERARAAREAGATRFCLSAAWRGPKDKDLDQVTEMVAAVKEMGMETCATLGMLREGQAERLADAGLDYYNHNLDTSPEHYDEVISTRTYDDRLDTLQRVQDAGMKVCCGGILGLGEERSDRAGLIAQLAALDPQPQSVPINNLVPVPGTPMGDREPVDAVEFIRTVAAARIALPTSYIRLAAGRLSMTEAEQALCFMAGANSIFYGEQLLTTPNPDENSDRALLDKLGMTIEEVAQDARA
ncbi:biotin synthase [Thiohalorhabdus denitrificans]|uniref:Biotin synthase n=1 Tax=Thiohalorhabdus denitrificans TaxID=381306 RepID=A0A0P9C7B8_9GAMM|nr:biotin synthase BioB [Thiohalorhabdus denitrificans]KPV41022.1 biotin synthase [Thiohalorhabdus denitrificans]SCY41375.1 biotin synthase [Thiohalorhabdus denitrificans]